MEHGIIIAPGATGERFPDSLVENVRLAEKHGFDMLGVGDSQNVHRELFASMGLMAGTSQSVRIGPTVTNPVTRHPAVIASGISTLSEMTGGRAFLGIASGNVAVTSLGMNPASLRELRQSIDALRSLCDGRSVEYEGNQIELDWIDEDEQISDIPLLLAAGGPKTQELAGFAADGVIIGNGLEDEVIQEALENVERGAQRANRDLNELETWVIARSTIADSRQMAIDRVKPILATAANHSFRGSVDPDVPAEYTDAVREFREEYQTRVENGGETIGPELIDKYGLTDLFVDRFGVVGTPEDCLEQLERIEASSLVDGVIYSLPPHTSVATFIRQMGQNVIGEI